MHYELISSHLLPRPIINALATSCVLVLLSACASSPPSAPVEGRDIENSALYEQDTASAYEDVSYEVKQARYYTDLANQQEHSNAAIEARLSAAEFYIQANDLDSASQALNELERNPQLVAELSREQSQRKQIINAYIEYQNGYVQAALQTTQTLINQDAFETQQLKVDALLLSAFAFQSLGDYDSALSSLIQRESLLSGRGRAETSRYIWQVINSMPIEDRQFVSETTLHAAVRHRIEQSMAGEVGSAEHQPSQFDRWRQHPSQHAKQKVELEWTARSPQVISVLLPTSSRFGKASQAVRDGIEFQHALNQSPFKPIIDYYDLGSEPQFTPDYFRAAMQRGADLLIGPIGLSYANALAYTNIASSSTPSILLGGDQQLGRNQNRLTLSPEREAQQIAEHALQLGYVNAAILVPETPKGQRLANAFSQAWLSRGGKVSKTVPYSSKQFDHSTELKLLFNLNQSHQRHKVISDTLGIKTEFAPYRRQDIDFVFMIADSKAGRILRPQINFFSGNSMVVIASSDIYDGIPNRNENLDLENTIFPAMPWMLASQNLSAYAGQLNMLFALGADSYRLAANLDVLKSNSSIAIDGYSGTLYRERSGDILFEPVWAEFTDGEVVSQELSPLLTEKLTQTLDQQGSAQTNQQFDTPRKEYNDSNWDSRE